MYIEFDILVALFLKPCRWMFVELGYLVRHESHFQSLSIGIKYIVLECLYTIPHIKCIPEACGFLKWQKTQSCCIFFLNNATMCWTRNGAVEHLSGYSYQLYQWWVFSVDFCRFCVLIRFFHPRHNGQWPPTSKDLLSQMLSIYFPILILEKEPVFSLLNVQC